MEIDALIITGPSGSGKDTLVKIIGKTRDIVNVKFSRPVKNFLEDGFGLKPGDLDTQKGKDAICEPLGLTYREVLILTYGDSSNTIFQDIWLNIAVHKAVSAKHSRHLPVFTDVRSLKELEKITEYLNPGVIELSGRGVKYSSDLGFPENFWEHHPKIKNYAMIVNNGTKEGLRESLAQIEFLKCCNLGLN